MLNLGRGPLLVVANVVFVTYGLHIHTVSSPQQLQKYVSLTLAGICQLYCTLAEICTLHCTLVSRSLPLRKLVTYIVYCTLAENGKLHYVQYPCRKW